MYCCMIIIHCHSFDVAYPMERVDMDVTFSDEDLIGQTTGPQRSDC